jgi:hypothetical protein
MHLGLRGNKFGHDLPMRVLIEMGLVLALLSNLPTWLRTQAYKKKACY